MSKKIDIVDDSTGDIVAVADVSNKQLRRKQMSENGKLYLPDDEITVFAGSSPSAENALVDEQRRRPETQDEFIVAVKSRVAGTELSAYERNSDNEADLATRYEEGDVVSTPSAGVGVIAGVITENKGLAEDAPDTDLEAIDASEDSPSYVVVTEDEEQGMTILKASDLESTTIETEVDPLDSTKEAAAMAELAPDGSEYAELDFTMPESWRESPQPARVIALKAFQGMGGSFDGCVREMRSEISDPDEFCGAFLDEVLGYPYWRGDSPLPGD